MEGKRQVTEQGERKEKTFALSALPWVESNVFHFCLFFWWSPQRAALFLYQVKLGVFDKASPAFPQVDVVYVHSARVFQSLEGRLSTPVMQKDMANISASAKVDFSLTQTGVWLTAPLFQSSNIRLVLCCHVP